MKPSARNITFLRFTVYLHAVDILVIAFALILSLINLAFASRITLWWFLILVNCLVIGGVCVLAYARNVSGSKALVFLHDWYVAPITFFSFKELYLMIKPIHFGRDYDGLLIEIDRWLFGGDPTQWLMHIANPPLTEILQIAYTSFYFLFLILAYELYRRNDLDMFHYFMFTCVYGFFLSYLGYFFLPAIGPRFTLHEFSSLDTELPGLLLTPYLRWFVNAGGSVPIGVPDEIAIAGAQRDVFPSGHTMMTLVLIYLSAKLEARARHFIFIIGTLLIIATVYQRYHYVIDLVAGAGFMAVCVLTSSKLYAYIKKHFQTTESQFLSRC